LNPEWYYNGHYGQIGPLTREQMEELIDGGVIAGDTLVWKSGMTDWIAANRVPEFGAVIQKTRAHSPPPLPTASPYRPPDPPSGARPTRRITGILYPSAESDKSRMAGGVLNLLLPGVGRIYLGYAAIGVLQLVLSLCGVGAIWSWIDGVIILAGGVKLDGYGRRLKD
jgi:hypothetical protein